MGLPIKQLTKEKLDSSIAYCKNYFIGIETFLTTMGEQMEQFLSEIFATPKGVLFYGPPGTGKSDVSKTFCQQAGFYFAAPPMAAGDFNKGIVGDSERMLNSLADRA